MEKVCKHVGRPRSFDPDEALQRALMTFWAHGYEGASMTLLQEATGLSAPQLYRAFESKERLFESAVALYQKEYGFGVADSLPVIDALTDYLDRAAREFTSEPGLGCLVSTGLLTTGRDAEAAAAVVRAERDQALTALSTRLAKAVADGELSESVDVCGLTRTIGALIQGMSVQARDGATREDLGRLVATVRDLLVTSVNRPASI